jgi:hypothetical protein
MIINIKTFKNKIKHIKETMFNTILVLNNFSINENFGDSKKRTDVINLINNNEFETTPDEFRKSLLMSKHKEMLSNYTVQELSQMKLFKLKNYNIGYALKQQKNGIDIVAVHNNEQDVKNIADFLIKSAIKNGGNMLDHFDIDILNNLYSSNGFIEYNRDEYDSTYDENGSFANKYGKLDIIYRKLQ